MPYTEEELKRRMTPMGKRNVKRMILNPAPRYDKNDPLYVEDKPVKGFKNLAHKQESKS